MGGLILILVIIGAIFAIGSGVWVAIALVKAISLHQTTTPTSFQKDKTNHTLQENHEMNTHGGSS